MGGVYWCEAASPVGPLLLTLEGEALTRIHFQGGANPLQPSPQWRHDRAPFATVIAQLAEYFAGARRGFSVPLAPRGTAFQLGVWRALRTIPFGETISYGELAARLGSAPRAVGAANGANPLPIIVPCHRVIGADGSLTGFGGGLPIKRALLELEGAGCVADLFNAAAAPGRANA
ncbi:MAG TPA: methylated-DNA--[protein]-cysteine S-methyltransferase [Steroidobacteraceae bacterium]|jgi:methylated-DNA-[protein]-cysteine S-methyltransferase|nr:methylated-DNA--[protein]-cysteine S-methyltransferase [Steroidobacteraceae bacterium]